MNNSNTKKREIIKLVIFIVCVVTALLILAGILISTDCDADAKPVLSEDSEIYKVIDEFDISSKTNVTTIEDKETGVQYMIVYAKSVDKVVAISVTPRIRFKSSHYLE